MNTPTPTPITEEHKRLWTQLYNLAHDEIFDVASSDGPAHKLIADSEAMAVAALTAERDQLRAENATLRAAQKACEACDEPTAFEVRQLRADCDNETKWAAHYLAQSIADKSRAEKAERAETVALARWNGALERALKAEAEVAKLTGFYNEIVVECGHDLIVREYRQRGELLRDETNRRKKAEAELATERARLDSGAILLIVAGERVWHCGVDLRSAIDAGVKEGAK